MKMPKILFFIAGMTPTAAENEAALEIGAVAMRNRSLIQDTDNPEVCDAVAGEVIPKPYARFPVIKTLAQAITIIRDKQKAENAKQAAFLAEGAPGSAEGVGTKGTTPGKDAPGAAKPGTNTPGWKANA